MTQSSDDGEGRDGLDYEKMPLGHFKLNNGVPISSILIRSHRQKKNSSFGKVSSKNWLYLIEVLGNTIWITGLKNEDTHSKKHYQRQV